MKVSFQHRCICDSRWSAAVSILTTVHSTVTFSSHGIWSCRSGFKEQCYHRSCVVSPRYGKQWWVVRCSGHHRLHSWAGYVSRSPPGTPWEQVLLWLSALGPLSCFCEEWSGYHGSEFKMQLFQKMLMQKWGRVGLLWVLQGRHISAGNLEGSVQLAQVQAALRQVVLLDQGVQRNVAFLNKRFKLSIGNMGLSFQGEEKDVFV